MSKSDFTENFKGYQIIDCVVRSKTFMYFVLREDYTLSPNWHDGDDPPAEADLRTRIVCFTKDPAAPKEWTHIQMVGFKYLLAGVSKIPKEQFVGVDLNGHVYILGGGDNFIEDDISGWQEKGINRGVISKSRLIDGYLYVTGGGRSVGYRMGKNNWKSLTQGLPFKYDSDWRTAGFDDIDGFTQSDIYCVGGKGDVWHFDGNKWKQIHFPGNLVLYTVCCASDGYVYISGYGGTTFKGRGDQWKQIYKGQMTIPFKDMVWYENKVWCTSDYGLWVIENDTVIEADVDPEVKVCSGYLSAEAGVLLLGGYNGAAYKENGAWHVLF
jgi:hypothetical protein